MIDILLIGLGKVGWKYDLFGPKNQFLTHFKSIKKEIYLKENQIQLSVYDSNIDVKRQFQQANGGAYRFLNSEYEIKSQNWDLSIVAISTDEIVPFVIRNSLFDNSSKVILEKPVSNSFEKYELLLNAISDKSKARIAFPRRTLPSTNRIKEIVGSTGEEWEVKISYSGGQLNILSHFLDLISCIFGDLRIDDISQNGKLIKLTNDKKNASVIAYQKSEINQEDTEIFINGKVMIQYRQSGRRITMSENNKNEVLLGENEIEKMLLFECKDYIDWASFSVASKLPKLNNATLVNLLKKFGKDCE